MRSAGVKGVVVLSEMDGTASVAASSSTKSASGCGEAIRRCLGLAALR